MFAPPRAIIRSRYLKGTAERSDRAEAFTKEHTKNFKKNPIALVYVRARRAETDDRTSKPSEHLNNIYPNNHETNDIKTGTAVLGTRHIHVKEAPKDDVLHTKSGPINFSLTEKTKKPVLKADNAHATEENDLPTEE